nr:2828_t:CDS:2 [Entrophospora candida]CAG8450005.1 15695_t:CDS:2 [Entrophospora candida]
MSQHFGMRLKNIIKAASFIELKAMFPKDRDVFDFMLRPPNVDTPIVDSPILNIPEEKIMELLNLK